MRNCGGDGGGREDPRKLGGRQTRQSTMTFGGEGMRRCGRMRGSARMFGVKSWRKMGGSQEEVQGFGEDMQ